VPLTVWRMQHTHFGSATHIAATFLGVLFAGTVWRLAAFHGLRSNRPLIRGWARMALFQY
jgi:hypothetical protein